MNKKAFIILALTMLLGISHVAMAQDVQKAPIETEQQAVTRQNDRTRKPPQRLLHSESRQDCQKVLFKITTM